MGCSKISSKRDVYNSNTVLPQKQEKHQIDNLTVHLKHWKNNNKKTLKISRRKEIIRNQAEINEKEMKETIVKVNKTKSWFEPDSSRKKERRIKSTKLEMKKESLQQTMQKYKGL